MNIDKYPLLTGNDKTIFEFTSQGPKGDIKKLILFQKISDFNFYNLAFGDKDEVSNSISDLVVSDNGDTEKVLATVVSALYFFFIHYPNAVVYATGSTPARTRLYRMGITHFYEEAMNDFYLYGQIGDNIFPFRPEIKYDGFLVERKLH